MKGKVWGWPPKVLTKYVVLFCKAGHSEGYLER